MLFDFDGTLVGSLDVKAAAFRNIYVPFGPDIAGQAVAYYRAHTGIWRGERIRHCHRTLLGQELEEEEVQRLSDAFGSAVESDVAASPTVPGALAFLQQHSGNLPLYIVSATPQPELERIVQRRAMTAYFADVFGSPPGKLALIHDIIATHWYEPKSVIMVGDGRADYDAAAANGIRFIGRVPNGQASVFPPGTATIADLNELAL